MDIDIDFNTLFSAKDIFPNAIRASMVQEGILRPHQVGVYFQPIPKDKITGLAAIPYDKAEDFGFLKIDLLHFSALDQLSSKEGVRELVRMPPDWNLLMVPSAVKKLAHIGSYYDLISTINPKSIQELADILALIRPGKAAYLEDYLLDRAVTRLELYKKPKDGKYYFKKSHAVAYAHTIVLQLHLIKAGIL